MRSEATREYLVTAEAAQGRTTWLEQQRRPVWTCMLRRALEIGRRHVRKCSHYNPLAGGVHFRLEGGLLYVAPTPAPSWENYFNDHG